MTDTKQVRFIDAAERVGAQVTRLTTLKEAVNFISEKAYGTTLVPETILAKQHGLRSLLTEAGVEVFSGKFREAGEFPGAGVTFSNFCMADTGTVVLDSTDESIRLATTLPEIHFIFVDPKTILEDNLAAAQPMNELHQGNEAKFVAYITGPSRTADIERVLTIGCHGPREVHILLVENISDNLLEN